MPRPTSSRTESDPVFEREAATSVPVTSPTGLSADQIGRWAELIAEGRDEVPVDLADADRERLKTAVRHRLRDRLVRLVARAIAMNLHRELGKKRKDDSHDRT